MGSGARQRMNYCWQTLRSHGKGGGRADVGRRPLRSPWGSPVVSGPGNKSIDRVMSGDGGQSIEGCAFHVWIAVRLRAGKHLVIRRAGLLQFTVQLKCSPKLNVQVALFG